MKIATWNVNSVKARQERLLAWLGKNQPDVLCLQELKVTDDVFPVEPLRAAGYHAAVWGQKTYNGVAILSKTEPEDVQRGFGDGGDDAHSRSIAATVAGLRIYSIYVPNGQTVGSDKYQYKLEWLRRLRRHLDTHHKPTDALLLCGDFNVAPKESDVANPQAWEKTVLFDPTCRAALGEIVRFGLVDVFDKHHPEGGQYSWWDYRMLAFPKNNGLRIDHILATEPVARRSVAATIDRQERKGKLPSDHAPVVVEIA
jgi:exodeoxyribonuclease III